MSKLSVKEFANALNMPFETVKTHIKRNKVQKGSDGLIDTDIDQNKRYIADQTSGSGLFSGVKKDVPVAATTTKRTSKQAKAPELSEEEKDRRDLDRRKRVADLEIAERGAELKRIELEKKAGNLLPVEIVEKIVTINCQAILKAIEGENENLASIISGGDRTRLASITKQLREIQDRAVKKAEKDALIEIENAIDTYQDERGRGERK